MDTFHENHIHKEPDFPFIFHFDTAQNENTGITHWHEGLEILCFMQGDGTVYSDMVPSSASAGDIVVINSGNLHSIHATGSFCQYYCLIIDKAFCDSFAIDIESLHFRTIVQNKDTHTCYDKIVQEMAEKSPYFKIAVKSHVLNLLVCLCRQAVLSSSELLQNYQTGNKIAMVKSAISYIRQHYKEEITIDEICSHIGFSKYYFCRVFKEITGKTAVDYINFLRCENAQFLLSTGQYNVSQSAELSGIHNLSYFSKIYKKQIGISPSKEKNCGTIP